MLVIYSFVTDELFCYKSNNIYGVPHFISLYIYDFCHNKRTCKINVGGNIDQ